MQVYLTHRTYCTNVPVFKSSHTYSISVPSAEFHLGAPRSLQKKNSLCSVSIWSQRRADILPLTLWLSETATVLSLGGTSRMLLSFFLFFFFFCVTRGSLNTESPSVQENERHVLLGERSRDITREEETGVRYTCLIIRFCRTFKWQKIVQLIWGYFSWRLQILNNFFFSFFYANHNQQVKGWRRKANNYDKQHRIYSFFKQNYDIFLVPAS